MKWTDSRLAALDTDRDWKPNAAAALVKFEQRKRAALSFRRRLTWTTAAAAAIFAGAMFVPVSGSGAPPPAACTQQRLWQKLLPSEAPRAPQPTAGVEPLLGTAHPANPLVVNPPVVNPFAELRPKPAAPPKTKARAADTIVVANYKEIGARSAAVVCEVYTDYQCPHCATLFRDTIPPLMAEYVKAGKVRLRHRDFPLPGHPYARLAARYANAAGELGYYETAVNQIFATQPQWSATGDVDAALAAVLTPSVMQKVRALLEHDAKLDNTIAADVAAGRDDQLHQTPTLVVVSKGKRQVLPGAPSYSLLKTYLDQVLAGQ
jgi:protein-disulfide isomerase